MSALLPEESPQTLGDLIHGLEAGKPCPWCGCSLERGGPLRDVGNLPGHVADGSSDDPTLVCPDCGFEICDGHASEGTRRGSPFSAAA